MFWGDQPNSPRIAFVPAETVRQHVRRLTPPPAGVPGAPHETFAGYQQKMVTTKRLFTCFGEIKCRMVERKATWCYMPYIVYRTWLHKIRLAEMLTSRATSYPPATQRRDDTNNTPLSGDTMTMRSIPVGNDFMAISKISSGIL